MESIKWGILGAGAIVDRWIKGAFQVEGMEIAGIASRTRESAVKKASEWGISTVMTYEEMLADPAIQVCYIPVPHTAHKELAIRAIEAGKHVLVEKPAGVNAAEWLEMTQAARENHVFLMEAYWTQLFPATTALLEEIRKGTIGDVRIVESSFCFRVADDNHSRLVDPKRAGGGLLDVGVYNLHFAETVFGKAPEEIRGFASIGDDSLHLAVDDQCASISKYEGGGLGIMSAAIRTNTIDTAYVYGTSGYIVIPEFWRPQKLEIHTGADIRIVERKVPQKFAQFEDEGYQFEVIHVNDCIRKGLLESPEVPWKKTEDVLLQCDELRRQWGLNF